MSVIFYTKPRGEHGDWDLEEHKMGDDFQHESPEDVLLVEADGLELQVIRDLCTGIGNMRPHWVQNDKVVILEKLTWFGDHARFIAANVRF